MRIYRAAVVGCGLIGSRFARDAGRIGVYTHAGAYAACPRTELVGLCDTNPALLDEAGERWGVTSRHRNPAEMIAACQPDIVSLCTPDATHSSLLRLLLASPGVQAVFTEKPLALDLDDAKDLVALVANRAVLLNYSRRFSTSHRALKAQLDAGAIGRVVAVNGIYTKGLKHNGTHWLDLARWLVGEITAVCADDVLKEPGADPTLDVRMRFAEGATGALTGLPAENYSVFEMDVLGTAGRVRITEGGWSISLAGVEASPRHAGYATLADPHPVAGDMRDVALHAVNELVARLDDPMHPLPCTARDGWQALAVAEAAHRSAASGAWETVETFMP